MILRDCLGTLGKEAIESNVGESMKWHERVNNKKQEKKEADLRDQKVC